MLHWLICLTIQGYNSSLHSLQGCFHAQKRLFVSFKHYLLKLTASSQGRGVEVKTHHTNIVCAEAGSLITHVMQTVTGCPFLTYFALFPCPLLFTNLPVQHWIQMHFWHKLHNIKLNLPVWQQWETQREQTPRKYIAINSGGVITKQSKPKILLLSLCDLFSWSTQVSTVLI